MTTRVPIRAVVDGMEMQSDEMRSFLHRPTGRVVTVSDEVLAAADEDAEWTTEEELEDARGILTANHEYLALPDRFEIDEYHMMEQFARSLPDESARDRALTALRGRGAFRYFKDTVHQLGLATPWYAYRDQCYREVARAWCDEHGVEYEESAPEQPG